MAYWIFKIAEQDLFTDVHGDEYVYNNTHSIRVVPGDIFLYLDKRKKYSFTGTGIVHKISEQLLKKEEPRKNLKVKTVFTAKLKDMMLFKKPLTISLSTKHGRRNRAQLGITDVNLLGWSRSMPSLNEHMYEAILDLADTEKLIPSALGSGDFSIPDNWGKTKTRGAIKKFSGPVMARSNSTCIVCGTSLPGLLDAAHLSPYAVDRKNRANPANGICLCKYCHRAFDLRLIAIQPNGDLLVASIVEDQIAHHHFSPVNRKQRLQWLKGVDQKFLNLTVQFFNENLMDTH